MVRALSTIPRRSMAASLLSASRASMCLSCPMEQLEEGSNWITPGPMGPPNGAGQRASHGIPPSTGPTARLAGAPDGRDPNSVLARSGGEQVVASASKDYHCVLTLCDVTFRLMFLLCRHASDLFAHRASR